jgi:saccharopine dehydrogenase-like NADP-dependent oxidoreductase
LQYSGRNVSRETFSAGKTLQEKHSRQNNPGNGSRKRIQGMDQARQSRKQDPGTGSKYRIQAEYLRKLSGNSPETKQKIFQVFLQAFLKKILRKDLLNI